MQPAQTSHGGNATPVPVLPPPKLYPLPEPPVPSLVEPYANYKSGVPIVLDLGTAQTRIGFATDQDPWLTFPTQLSRYRDRKILRTFTLIGTDANLDANTRQSAKSPFDGPMISNWEYLETILDYCFVKLGVTSEGRVDNPIMMSEILACPLAQHKGMQELLFETYNVPAVTFGIDSLCSFYYNKGSTGLVISAGNETTHVIPVLNGRAVLSQAKRLNWGGHSAALYLLNLIQLKYPHFPGRVTPIQAEALAQQHCYVAPFSYEEEVKHFLDKDEGLDERDHIIQAPYTEVAQSVKSEEELAKIAERRKESGRKLQEQAAKARLERLIKKEQELEYYRTLEQKSEEVSQKEFKRLLDREGFDDEAGLSKTIKNLERSIKRSRKQDVGDEESDAETQTFPLLDIPDDQLDEGQIKQKRHQRLMKSNYEARMRAKVEKQREQERIKEEERKDEEWRLNDLEGWIKSRRDHREQILQRMKEKKRLKEELNNRRSVASQMRMKSIANLASENSGSSRKRRRGGTDDEDTFGANDDDWAVYHDITNASDTEEDEEMAETMRKIEAQLLEYDPDFNPENMMDVQNDWTNSLIHTFLRGRRPFDSNSRAEAHQFHLNVERVRVPEAVFQPSMAGLDQAGVVELASDILLHRLPKDDAARVCKDIFLTGGYSLVKGFDDRLRNELRSLMPVNQELNIRKASDGVLDAWRGMRKWISEDEGQASLLTRAEYEEYGPDYIKEHRLGNVSL
ncbi:hypothetical protein V1511DRAFT_502200, partial [Dipodascopsis uninucleata]